MAHLREEAAGKGANVVVLLGVDPPNRTGHFEQFEVHGYLATVYVWADLYYCPNLTNSPAPEMPEPPTAPVQFTFAPATPPVLAALATLGAR